MEGGTDLQTNQAWVWHWETGDSLGGCYAHLVSRRNDDTCGFETTENEGRLLGMRLPSAQASHGVPNQVQKCLSSGKSIEISNEKCDGQGSPIYKDISRDFVS